MLSTFSSDFQLFMVILQKKIDTIYDGENNDPIKEEKDVAPIGFYYLRKCTLCRLKSIPSITMHRKALQIDTSVFRSIVFIW